MQRHRIIYTIAALLLMMPFAAAQTFTDVDWGVFERDSVMPYYRCSVNLDDDYQLHDYTARIEYPEFVPMSKSEIKRYALDALADTLPSWPQISSSVGVSTKQGVLDVTFVPIVFLDGCYQRINSFKLVVNKEVNRKRLARSMAQSATRAAAQYADNSVMATGRWVKIRVPESGVYKITAAELAKMGFKNPARVRLFGYGGYLLPETGLASLADDLQEVPMYRKGNTLLFYANGTIKWKYESGAFVHEQNHYSTHGYYFLNESEGLEPISFPVISNEGKAIYKYTTYPDHALYEKEDMSLCAFGRKLLDSHDFSSGRTRNYKFTLPGVTKSKATIAVGFGTNGLAASSLGVYANGKSLGNLSVGKASSTDKGVITSGTFSVADIGEEAEITLKHSVQSNAVNGFLDYIRVSYVRDLALRGSFTAFRGTSVSGLGEFKIATAKSDVKVWRVTTPSQMGEYPGTYADGCYTVVAPSSSREELVVVDVNGSFPSVEVVGEVPNQNLHALGQTDMVIIVPSNRQFLVQAERIAELHRTLDSLTVAVVTAEQVYNEFSSGTPDATAYRRLMKMLYDRASNAAEAPKYLLLMGDAFADNRLLTYKGRRQEDYLLCYQSQNSVSTTASYVLEDYFGFLDDGEGSSHTTDKVDIGVGRIPAQNLSQLTPVVDKIINYALNKEAGAWQNNIVVLADDGDEKNPNSHMRDAEEVASLVNRYYPSFMVRRIYWDDYPVVTLSTGNSYPAATAAIKEQLEEGALIMNYSGHGSSNLFSPEMVWKASDMAECKSPRLPMWVTASCDISPFDLGDGSIGEEAMLNPTGGAVAMLTTTRTVYQSHNAMINQSFMRNVLKRGSNGKAYAIGDAMREAKVSLVAGATDLTENKLQYVLLGDPALRLNVPGYNVVVDSFKGEAGSKENKASAGTKVKVEGHIESDAGALTRDFNGVVISTMFDYEQQIVTKNNTDLGAFKYNTHKTKLYSGSDSVVDGRFEFTVPVPMDISYSDENGLLNLFAITHDKARSAQGVYGDFIVGGTSPDISGDKRGPDINLYLNTPAFVSGGDVNSSPCLFVQLSDVDGINTVGSGIGHDVVAVVDNNPDYTFNLNSLFVPTVGDYTSGTAVLPIPELPEGEHTLMVRAWDLLNNSSAVMVTFNVVPGMAPQFAELRATPNPVHSGENVLFALTHNRPQSEIKVTIEVYNFQGQVLWSNSETTSSPGYVYTYNWNVAAPGGQPMPAGVYLYHAKISSDGSPEQTKTGKIIVLDNK